MRKLMLLVLLSIQGCAHLGKPSCDEYCAFRGGQCNYVVPGEGRYNTITGEYTERATIYSCRFNK